LDHRNCCLPEANRAAGIGGGGNTGAGGQYQSDHDRTAEPSCLEKLVHNDPRGTSPDFSLKSMMVGLGDRIAMASASIPFTLEGRTMR
jgi:hypothetical protein